MSVKIDKNDTLNEKICEIASSLLSASSIGSVASPA